LKFLQLEPLKQKCHAGCMKKGTKRKKARKRRQIAAGGDREPDFNQVAQHMVRLSTGQEQPTEAKATTAEISRVMAEMGRRGGKIGGKKRAESLTPQKRSEIALKAARSRWDKAPKIII
jgi:hypothetical protein